MASVLRNLVRDDKSLLPVFQKGKTLFDVIRHLPNRGTGRFVMQTQQLKSVNENIQRKVYKITHVDLTKDPLGKGRAKLQEYWMTPKGFKPKSFKSEYLGMANNGNWQVLYSPTFDWLLSKKIEPSLLSNPIESATEYEIALATSKRVPIEHLQVIAQKSPSKSQILQAIETYQKEHTAENINPSFSMEKKQMRESFRVKPSKVNAPVDS